ncbi:hypothetical protein SMC26_14735 [Actinomadura fulvescens]|uniref:Lipoprotein n=1 Tax=Actinomadura fulvescens TaxID=46160 RepID=A0ABP6D4I9_9ACTN
MRLTVTALLLTLSLAATACANDRPAAAPSTPPALSAKAAFIQQADKICRAADDKFPPGDTDTLAKEVAALKLSNRGMRVTMAELRRLPPPRDDAAALDKKFFAPYENAIRDLERIQRDIDRALARHDDRQVRRLIDRSYALTDADEVTQALVFAEKYGLKSCAGEPEEGQLPS